MNILLTLDYEIFFGKNTGSIERSIILPTNILLDVLNKYNIKASFFVDSGYILKLDEQRKLYSALEKDYIAVIEHIKYISDGGHDIQLHIHPHWEDSYFDGSKWVINTNRYRLHEFSEEDIDNIFYRYKKALTNIVGDNVFAYRAGGWCIQPFEQLSRALKNNGIWLDSTLFNNGINRSNTHFFDFSNMAKKSVYRFEEDPLLENNNGYFIEVPISSHRVYPWFYWKLAFHKMLAGKEHQMLGDGQGISSGSKLDKIRMLLARSYMAVSMDGYKSKLLETSFNYYKKRNSIHNDNFVIIGHPKAFTSFSIKQLERFIHKNRGEQFITYSQVTCQPDPRYQRD